MSALEKSDLAPADFLKVRKMLLTYGPALGVSEDYDPATGHLTGVYTGLSSHKVDTQLASSTTKVGGKIIKGLKFKRLVDRDLSKYIVRSKYESKEWRTTPDQYDRILLRRDGSRLWSHENKPGLLLISRGKRLLTETFNMANKNREYQVITFLAEQIHDSNYATDLL